MPIRREADWAEWLPMCEAFYNSSVHSSTGQTPFDMNGVMWTDATTYAMRSHLLWTDSSASRRRIS